MTVTMESCRFFIDFFSRLNGFVKNRKFSPHEKIKKSKRFFDFLALVVELGEIFSRFL